MGEKIMGKEKKTAVEQTKPTLWGWGSSRKEHRRLILEDTERRRNHESLWWGFVFWVGNPSVHPVTGHTAWEIPR